MAAEPIPFSLKRGIPEIEVIINDSIKATFVIDTGADHIYIDKTFAEKHGLLSGRTQAMRPTRGSIGSTEAKLFRVENLEFGDISLSDLSMVAIDLVSQIKDTSMGYPDGVIGYSFLKNYKTLINYHELVVSFYDEDSIDTFGYIVLPTSMKFDRHLILVTASFNRRAVTRLILDTGSSFSILSPFFAEKHDLINSTSIDVAIVGGIDWETKFLLRDIFSNESAFDLHQTNGILGTTFLLGRTLIIDYQKETVSFLFKSPSNKFIDSVRLLE